MASRRDGDGQLGPVHVSTAFHRVARHGSRLPRSQQDALRRHPTVQWLHAEACRRVQEMGAQSLGNIAWCVTPLAQPLARPLPGRNVVHLIAFFTAVASAMVLGSL